MKSIDNLEESKSIERIASHIVELINNPDISDACRRGEVAALLSSLMVGIELKRIDIESLIEYSETVEEKSLLSIALRHLECPLPVQHYPLVSEIATKNFIASVLHPLLYVSDSLIEEARLSQGPLNPAIERLLRLLVGCSGLLNDKEADVVDLESLIEEELHRNSEVLESLARIASEAGIQLDTAYLMKIQPTVFEMLTSNNPVTTNDVNYRKKLNLGAGAAHSLQGPKRPNPDKLISRYGNYIDFIEATAATKRGGYVSTFGFLHRVQVDEMGNPFIVEYPHVMYEEDVLGISHPITDKLEGFERDFQRNHDMLHNILPVYADHFMIHHPTAPITLGGYLPEYIAFGEGMRKDKSSYELALGILHRQIMEDRFLRDPAILDQHTTTVAAILDDLIDMQQYAACNNKVIDHVSFVIMQAAMSILPYNSPEYQALLDKYEKLDLPNIKVSPSDVYKLLVQQEIVLVDLSLIASAPVSASKDKILNHVCENIDDAIAIVNLQNVELDYASAEQGSEYVVQALREMEIEPNNFTSPVVLKGRDRLRWTGITASSRRLKGFNEKIHGLNTVRFWDKDKGEFKDVTPVSLVGEFQDHFKRNADEYNFRMWFRGLSDAILHEFKNVALSQEAVTEVDRDAPPIIKAVDYCMRNLLDDNYQPLDKAMKNEIDQFMASSDESVATRLASCFKAYETLATEAAQAAERNGRDFKTAREQLTRRLMSLSG